jgi:hypothetical protein
MLIFGRIIFIAADVADFTSGYFVQAYSTGG